MTGDASAVGVNNGSTSRSKSGAFSAQLDTVRIRGEVARMPDPRAFDSSRTTNLDTGVLTTSMATVMESGITLHVDHQWGHWAWWEASVPNVLRGRNTIAASLNEVIDLTASIYNEARAWVTWSLPLEDLRIARLDSVRDFRGVHQIPDLLEGLRCLSLPYRTPTRGWDADSGMTLSLARGPRSRRWMARLYSKYDERLRARPRSKSIEDLERHATELQESEGVLRYELVARGDVLKQRGLDRLGDLSDQRVVELNRHYFHRAGYGTEVGGATRLKAISEKAVMDGVGKEMAKLRQMYMTEALGLPPTQCLRVRQDLRRLGRQYGLNIGDFLLSEKEAIRLDYSAGTAVPSAMALGGNSGSSREVPPEDHRDETPP